MIPSLGEALPLAAQRRVGPSPQNSELGFGEKLPSRNVEDAAENLCTE
jgi:hypothetical protein